MGVNLVELDVVEVAGLMGCKHESIPFGYFGVTMGGNQIE